MKSSHRILVVAAIACVLASSAQAHPGHGEVGPTHYVTSPEHLLTIGGISLAGILLVWGTRRARQKRRRVNR